MRLTVKDDGIFRDNNVTLAISSFDSIPALADESEVLNLAWTLDERPLLTADLNGVISRELVNEAQDGLPFANSYMVRDPYGEGMLKSVVAHFFSRTEDQFSVTAGAGCNSLLHALAQLAGKGPTYVIGGGYPDLPHWIVQRGGICLSRPGAHTVADHLDAVRETGALLVVMDRPNLLGADVSLRQLREICDGVAQHDAIVLVDESYANYCYPDYSAVNIVSEVRNLVVLRGLSKAYWLGGLRLGYCVASAPATEHVRAAVPPMLASSLSLRIGREVLRLGDIFEPLRKRTQEARKQMKAIFEASGKFTIAPSCESVPYVFLVGDAVGITQRLRACGILGKQQPFWDTSVQDIVRRVRLSVPLNPERMELLRWKIK